MPKTLQGAYVHAYAPNKVTLEWPRSDNLLKGFCDDHPYGPPRFFLTGAALEMIGVFGGTLHCYLGPGGCRK
jgi:hypothetical protein